MLCLILRIDISIILCLAHTMVCFTGYLDKTVSDQEQPIETLCNMWRSACPRSRGVNQAHLVELTYAPIETRITTRLKKNSFGYAHVNRSTNASLVDRSNLITIQCNEPSLTNATLATVNARSLKSNLDIIKPLIHELNIDILCLTETWLRPNDEYTPREFTPAGYSLFRVDRSEQTGGGVAILCHSGLKPKQ